MSEVIKSVLDMEQGELSMDLDAAEGLVDAAERSAVADGSEKEKEDSGVIDTSSDVMQSYVRMADEINKDSLFRMTPGKRVPKWARGRTVEPVRTEAKIGRNDACTCGSGKKYKQCCLKG